MVRGGHSTHHSGNRKKTQGIDAKITSGCDICMTSGELESPGSDFTLLEVTVTGTVTVTVTVTEYLLVKVTVTATQSRAVIIVYAFYA
jgi:hypothetical protein